MTASAPATDVWADLFEAARPRLPGAGRVAGLRRKALAGFRATGFPTQRQEEWRHTSVAPVTGTAFEPAAPPSREALDRAAALLETLPPTGADPAAGGSIRVVFVNGRFAPTLSSRETVPDGVEIASLDEVLARPDEDLEARIGSLVDGTGHAFAALNTALFEDGLFLRVPSGTRLASPVHLVFLAVGGAAATAVHPRLLYLLEDDAQASVVESWRGEAEAPWLSNTVVEAWIGRNARLDLLEIQEQTLEALHFRALKVHQAEDSRFASACLSIGAHLTRNDVHIRLEGPGAECRLDGLTLAQGDQHADHQTKIDHAKPQGTSHQLYKGILDDRATTAFSGRVLVEPHAQKTDAQQTNHNLLLSPDAVADSKPQLEIFADDVKCAHGATVGQLDQDALFYLRSRGIGPRAARRLLLRAFASEIAERVQDPELREIARATLERHLPGGEG